MMSQATFLIILQGLGISIQMVNAQVAAVTHNATVAIIVGAFTAGFQFVIQHLGNQLTPKN